MSILELLTSNLGLDDDEVTRFAKTAPYRYKVYEIPKRNGRGTRTIAHPAKNLKLIQRILVAHLSKTLPVHENAYAYIRGKGIKENAIQHVESRYLLKMDFADFFPSITPDLFITKLRTNGMEFDEIDAELLSRLLFRRIVRGGHLGLSIGAPSSPLISNFVMYDFDVAITEECKQSDVVYSRYADDLTFSTSEAEILSKFPYRVAVKLHETTAATIDVNHEKTVHSSKAHNRHVTGVTLSNEGQLSVGRKRKRRVSSMVHKFSHNELPRDEIKRLYGLISFITDIEPDFYQRMVRKYGQEVLNELKTQATNLDN